MRPQAIAPKGGLPLRYGYKVTWRVGDKYRELHGSDSEIGDRVD